MKNTSPLLSLSASLFFQFTATLFLQSAAQAAQPQSAPQNSCPDRILVAGIGDILVHDALQIKAHKEADKFFSIWKAVAPYTSAADVAYGNLEGPVAPGIVRSGQEVQDPGFRYDKKVYSGTDMMFNFHPQVITDVQKLGIDVVSTANNHSLDRTWVGIDKTIQELNKKNMPFTGTRLSNGKGDWGVVTQVKGKEIFWLACTEMTNGNPDRKNQVLKCYQDEAELTRVVETALKNYDAVIVTPHWGDEYQQIPNARQRGFAKRMSALGVTAIIGNHPHVMQPVEKIGNMVVAYSLGNFAAYQKDVERKTTVVLYLDLRENRNTRKLQVTRVKALPVYRDATTLYPAIDKLHPAALKYVSKHVGEQNVVLGKDFEQITRCQ